MGGFRFSTRRGAIAAAVVAGAMALSGHGGGAHATGGSAGCRHLEQLWQDAGGSGSAAQTAASIAMAESGGREDATYYNTNGTVDRGYWQINSVHGSLSTYDPAANAKAAVELSGDGADWSPWTTWSSGAYEGRC